MSKYVKLLMLSSPLLLIPTRLGVFGNNEIEISETSECQNLSNYFYDKYKVTFCSVLNLDPLAKESKYRQPDSCMTYLTTDTNYYSIRPIEFKKVNY